MFEGLKKKFSNFIGSIAKKEEERAEAETVKEAKAEITEMEVKGGEAPAVQPQPKQEMQAPTERAQPDRQERPKSPERPEAAAPKPTIPMPKTEERQIPRQRADPQPIKEAQPKVTMGTKIKGIFLREIRISETDVDPFMEQLRLSLLQSDVNYSAAEKILDEIKKELTGRPISSKGIETEITGIIRNSILKTLSRAAAKNIIELAKEKKGSGEPFRILFIGPNGAGKTTTIAKVANMLLKNGVSCMISASDTFRAAAIEQTVHHANKLGVEVVKGGYGADPASIAFDAIAHAKASSIDVVLIDSAGRQETNKSLMEEMRKMVRVAKPDMKIFIGESITGNSLLEQVSQFNAAVGLDGIILTKLDADAKGGNTLSILSETSVPILYFGVGEKYEDMIPYDPNFIINNIIPN